MNKFLDFYIKTKWDTEDEGPLKKLEAWSKEFWKVEKIKLPAIFAQKGYEDKGFGHTERIIANVSDLLDTHLRTVDTSINDMMGENFNWEDIKTKIANKKEIFNTENEIVTKVENDYLKNLKPTLILFYCAAHLHDIGMEFAGIYKALTPLIKAGGGGALHVGAIIHDYHNYSTFIILLELSHLLKLDKKGKETRNFDWSKNSVYLEQLFPDKTVENDLNKKLKELADILLEIHKQHFFHLIKRDFFIIIAILCLLHQKNENDFVKSIIRKYSDGTYRETVERLNGWLEFFKRADEWTKTTKKHLPIPDDKNFPGWEQVVWRGKDDNLIIDLHLVEALLQYGDKTEISIARLAREIKLTINSPNEPVIPLEKYLEDIQYDNQKGYICSEIARRKISTYARFRACRFIPVAYVEVRKDDTDKNKKIDIFIHYLRFNGDEKIFKLIRFHNEKDFNELDFLNSLQIHLPMMLRIGRKDSEIIAPIIDLTLRRIEHEFFTREVKLKNELDGMHKIKLEETLTKEIDEKLVKAMTENHFSNSIHGFILLFKQIYKEKKAEIYRDVRFPYTKLNRDAIREFSKDALNPEARNKSQGTKKVFAQTGDMVIPASFEVMAILNLFQEEV